MKVMKVKKRYGDMYLLPGLFSLTNLFFGFLSLQLTLRGHYRWAAFWIIVAAVMDGFDGIVARATKSQSDFGIELDSLADAVSFGAAASVLIFRWGLARVGAPGLFFSFVFLVAGVLRLARYNVRTKSVPDRKFYQGLTVPSAAMFISAWPLLHPTPIAGREAAFLFAVLVVLASLCMVSTLPYPNFSTILFRRRIDVRTALFIAIVLSGLVFYTKVFLAVSFSINFLSGPAVMAYRAARKSPRRKPQRKEIPS
jgi:CDP-diacylglycerol---serine O-phosphatidyltransferase